MYQPSDPRPRNLSLTTFHFPFNAILSILHRISGVVLIISLLGFLALLHLLIWHQDVTVTTLTNHWLVILLTSVFWSALGFHWLTGLRHLLAEHFLTPKLYQNINSKAVSISLVSIWVVFNLALLWFLWGEH